MMVRARQSEVEDEVPAWLTVMRSITGLTETPGSASNPKIVAMAQAIADAFPNEPGLQAYCDLFTGDDIAWCGLSAGYCMAMSGILPPFGPTDTDRFLWAQAWAYAAEFGTVLDQPRLGCVVVMTRSGGGHVTLYESDSGGSGINCRGGNQGDQVNVSSYAKSDVIAYVWPLAGGPIPPAERRELAKGDSGADVVSVQRTLGLPDDGDFGSVTDAGVRGFQRAWAVAGGADGVVGPSTWAALDELDAKMAAGDDGISDDLASAIDAIAQASPLRSYSWPDRGKAPPGYYAGMGKTFALAATRLEAGDAAAEIMAQAETGNPDTDALTWYHEEFAAQEMDNLEDGLDTLRHLFVLMIGLGMRESSADTWCGRDTSASNVQSDTCEAGAWQGSWNLSSCADEIDDLLDEYRQDPNGFRPTFTQGLYPSSTNLDNYGSGDGCCYQWLAKYSPAFAALMTGVGLRKLRQHWGPINRKEVDIVGMVDDFLLEVQTALESEGPPAPQPEPKPQVNVAIAIVGDVEVNVEQYRELGAKQEVDIVITEQGDVVVNIEREEAAQTSRARRWRHHD